MLHSLRPDEIARFVRDLEPLASAGTRIGVAVSGGPDSLALLLLAAAARPGEVEAATVDHGLRRDSRAEAETVARTCRDLGVPHATLPVEVGDGASLQAQARTARYAALSNWAAERGLGAILTAHHADDQAETLLMRLARGSGLDGLAGARRSRRLGPELPLVRPLLGWRKVELQAIVATAGLDAVQDPTNSDPRHDRSRVRALLATLDPRLPKRLAASAAHLAEAEQALAWTTERLAKERFLHEGEVLRLDPAGLPRELQRRLLRLAFARLGAPEPRGADLERAMARLAECGRCTLSGLILQGGTLWHLSPAPPRRDAG